MQKIIYGLALMSALWLVGCGTPIPTPTPNQTPVIVSPTGYRPVQSGDMIEGQNIGYHYVLPSLEQPVVTIAFSPYLLHYANIKPELKDGLIAFIRDLPKNKQVYAFDESNPKQLTPQLVSWDASKPFEIVFIPLSEDALAWSVTEEDSGEIQAAYKIVKRKDGGLRFIDAYGKAAIFSAGELATTNGTGMGLLFSARLALLRMILSDPKYQNGRNVMDPMPDFSQYDSRILKLDPTKEGISINRDWVITTIPGPNPGLAAP